MFLRSVTFYSFDVLKIVFVKTCNFILNNYQKVSGSFLELSHFR